MKNLLYILLIIISITAFACKKVLYGEGKTRVKGQVVDKFSGEPIPGAWVEILAQGDDSWYAPYIIDSIPTDHEGKFDHTFEAQKGVNYFARGSYHQLYANYNDLMMDLKDGWGNKRLKLELHPLVWVKVNFTNVPPLDQASAIGINGVTGANLSLGPTSNDTFIIGKNYCCKDFTLYTSIRIGTTESTSSYKLNLQEFDTLVIDLEY